MSNVNPAFAGILGIMSGDAFKEDPAPILGRDGGLYSDYDKWLKVDAMHVCSEEDFPCIKVIGGL